jgi:adenylyltransferase/sulfurtransferase
MMLNQDEKYRYNRHLILDGIGPDGQEKLKKASVLVVGAGGLGCPALLYLAAAGVGKIGIIDDDKVDISNLQRQILFSTASVGQNKAEAARSKLQDLNPHIHFVTFQKRLEAANALDILREFDIVIDGSDNFSTRYLVNDACVILDKPFVYGSIFKFEGQLSVFNYKNGPTYRCIFPDPPSAGSVPNCSEIGVLGVLPGIIGTQQANEALKIILGNGEPCSGKLLLYNALNTEYTSVKISRNEEVVRSVLQNSADFSSRNYAWLCGEAAPLLHDVKEITAAELKTMLAGPLTIVDVREPSEQPKFMHHQVINIPMADLENRMEEIPKTGPVVVICQSGKRSFAAVELLQDKHNFTNLVSLKGGMNGYV